MPMGLDSAVTDGGGQISGGQRQRVIIARALVNKPRLLFFDEATSALDNRTQATVQRSIERMNATRIIVAHRLSTIRDADRIIVLEAGRIVETGRYEELWPSAAPSIASPAASCCRPSSPAQLGRCRRLTPTEGS